MSRHSSSGYQSARKYGYRIFPQKEDRSNFEKEDNSSTEEAYSTVAPLLNKTSDDDNAKEDNVNEDQTSPIKMTEIENSSSNESNQAIEKASKSVKEDYEVKAKPFDDRKNEEDKNEESPIINSAEAELSNEYHTSDTGNVLAYFF
jgi:hypothetical protein